MLDLSVVVPVYRCQECLRALYDRVTRAVAEITSKYEILFVDDRSAYSLGPLASERSSSRSRTARSAGSRGQREVAPRPVR
jgi:glycosyltransferase involved in cell wall biosynthesis